MARRGRRSAFRGRPTPRSSPFRHESRHFHEAFKLRPKQIGNANVCNIVHLVESAVGALDRYLLGYYQRARTKFENLPQRHERSQPTCTARRSRRYCERAALEGGIGRVTTLAHPRYPIDGIFEKP